MGNASRYSRLIALALAIALALSGTTAYARRRSFRPLDVIAGDYACGFDGDSGYLPPGANSAVEVGGIFSLTIDKSGALSASAATLSIGDAETGTVCKYGSGSGSVGTAPTVANLGEATLNLNSSNGNSASCPSGDGTLDFGPTKDGLEFVYTNASGFVGHGDCSRGAAVIPPRMSFHCSYEVDQAALGHGSGVANIGLWVRQPLASIFGVESFRARDNCSFRGSGQSATQVTDVFSGTWSVPTTPEDGCPHTPLENASFVATERTVSISAPGVSHAICELSPTTLLDSSAGIQVTPSSIDFGSQSVGSTSSKTLTIKNTGSGSLSLSGYFVTSPFDADSSACSDELAAGAACPVVVSFQPTKTGNAKGALHILNDAAAKTVVKLTGLGK